MERKHLWLQKRSSNIFLRIKEIRPYIEICHAAFLPSVNRNIDDFKSTLIDHEGYHSKEIFHDPSLFKIRDLVLSIINKDHRKLVIEAREVYEKRANWNQILNFHRRKCSREFTSNNLADYLENYAEIVIE